MRPEQWDAHWVEMRRLKSSCADDIRAAGWRLLLHIEVGIGCNITTRWSFGKGDRCVSGEGGSDADALDEVRAKIGLRAAPAPASATQAGLDLDGL